jgi:hypothetical protein
MHTFELSDEEFTSLVNHGCLERQIEEDGGHHSVMITLASSMRDCSCCGVRMPRGEPCDCAYMLCEGHCRMSQTEDAVSID